MYKALSTRWVSTRTVSLRCYFYYTSHFSSSNRHQLCLPGYLFLWINVTTAQCTFGFNHFLVSQLSKSLYNLYPSLVRAFHLHYVIDYSCFQYYFHLLYINPKISNLESPFVYVYICCRSSWYFTCTYTINKGTIENISVTLFTLFFTSFIMPCIYIGLTLFCVPIFLFLFDNMCPLITWLLVSCINIENDKHTIHCLLNSSY